MIKIALATAESVDLAHYTPSPARYGHARTLHGVDKPVTAVGRALTTRPTVANRGLLDNPRQPSYPVQTTGPFDSSSREPGLFELCRCFFCKLRRRRHCAEVDRSGSVRLLQRPVAKQAARGRHSEKHGVT